MKFMGKLRSSILIPYAEAGLCMVEQKSATRLVMVRAQSDRLPKHISAQLLRREMHDRVHFFDSRRTPTRVFPRVFMDSIARVQKDVDSWITKKSRLQSWVEGLAIYSRTRDNVIPYLSVNKYLALAYDTT